MTTKQELDIESVIRWLLAQGYTTPEAICDAVDGISCIDDCVVIDDTPWTADDGNAPLEYDYDSYDSPRDVARQYVEGGDWGDDLDGAVNVHVFRWGIDSDGADCAVEESEHDIDLVHVLDHAKAIRQATRGDGCGNNPDDHDWTSEGEGGLRENPGVWSTGGTSMTVLSHCRKCGLHRTEVFPGVQRNPGQGDSVEYRMLSDDEIAEHRANGTMDADESDE